ncbi:MAG: hypothetical protein BI182_12295 [Acetobacterium sp. MES1]|uniref:restriction endonuclease subunit S n=1 Tax=Acetobacterium sp. MES1 TaxID=1899015 RepID=UPI000B9D4494|nr:restriction endonuclease subunit S [Acetobacterium sp. MES1]OXS26904.1 MAG: hypothetical protein BI182_12295 [Acetobacterium sp. MES1]
MKLRELVNRKIGYGIVQPGSSCDGGIPVIKAGNIIAGLNDVSQLNTTDPEIDAKYKRTKLQGGELVVTIVGSVGKTAIIPLDFAGCNLVRATALIDIVDKNDALWIKYFIDSPAGQNYIDQNLNTTVQPTLNIKSLEEMDIPMPDKDTRDKVVQLLGGIDLKIRVNEKINRNLMDQAVAIFGEMIWSQEKNGTIGDYCTVKSGFAFKSSWWTDKGVKVIKIGDINQDNLNLNACSCVDDDKVEKASGFIVKAGDLVIAMTGATIGKFAMIPERKETILVNQRVGKFFLGEEPLKKVPFIYCTLKQDEVYSEVIGRGQGSAQPNISASDVMTIPCVIPVQDEINKFNEITEPIFTSILKNQNENKQLANLRDSLLPKLMSGELDVSNLDI